MGGAKVSKEVKDTTDKHFCHNAFNIAVTGQAGVGKSCFINAFRNVKRGEESFAEEDVMETTTVPTPYIHPQHPKTVLWDLPGVGTPEFPKLQYDKKMNFKRYDFFLILSSQRFTENDVWLAQIVSKAGKNLFFVRTQIDIDVRKRNDLHETEVIEKVRSDCVKRLALNNFSDTENLVFLINNKNKQAYDFQKLQNALVKTIT